MRLGSLRTFPANPQFFWSQLNKDLPKGYNNAKFNQKLNSQLFEHHQHALIELT